MKALVYNGPGQKGLEERPKPVIEATTDAIIQITRTTICGTDLHILKDAAQLITHRFKLDDIMQAYDTLGKVADTKALKVIIEA